MLQVALTAEFGDYIAIVSSAEDVVAFEDVGVVQLLQCLDLALQHLLCRLPVY